MSSGGFGEGSFGRGVLGRFFFKGGFWKWGICPATIRNVYTVMCDIHVCLKSPQTAFVTDAYKASSFTGDSVGRIGPHHPHPSRQNRSPAPLAVGGDPG